MWEIQKRTFPSSRTIFKLRPFRINCDDRGKQKKQLEMALSQSVKNPEAMATSVGSPPGKREYVLSDLLLRTSISPKPENEIRAHGEVDVFTPASFKGKAYMSSNAKRNASFGSEENRPRDPQIR